VRVDLEPIDEPPRDMLSHQQALRQGLHVKFPRPEHGVAFLRERMAKADVILRFLDKRNSRIGLVRASFRRCSFHGWHEEHFRLDTLFHPRVRKARIDEPAAAWTQVRPSRYLSGDPCQPTHLLSVRVHRVSQRFVANSISLPLPPSRRPPSRARRQR
jgi:hypothetical protein